MAEGPSQVLSRDIRGKGSWDQEESAVPPDRIKPCRREQPVDQEEGPIHKEQERSGGVQEADKRRNLDALVSALEEVNGRREEEEGESEDLMI